MLGFVAPVLKQLGVSDQTVSRGIEAGRELVCILDDVRRSLQMEYGRVHCSLDVPPHNPAQLPLIARQDVTTSEFVVMDLEQSLGKFVTRGHVVNRGESTIQLSFQAIAGEQWTPVYELAAGAVLDTSSFFYRKLRARALVEAGSLQVLAQ